MRVICVDGGASKVAGAIVEKHNRNTFKIEGEIIEERYNEQEDFIHNFKPLHLAEQQKKSALTKNEKKQGKAYIKTVISIIEKLMTKDKALISIAMPGIKTTNKKGINIMANGPRIPNLTQNITDHFGKSIEILDLQSDADMCAWGEEYGENGLLRKVNSAYYIGGGTGIADGLKLKNQLCSFEQESKWIAKCWELKLEDGNSLESLISMPGINEEKNSRDKIAKNLALLFFERIQTVFRGWCNTFITERQLSNTHPYLGIIIDRIVIGQRLAEYFNTNSGKIIFNRVRDIFLEQCSAENESLRKNFTTNNINEKIILSKLRESPIIGLGAKAWLKNEK